MSNVLLQRFFFNLCLTQVIGGWEDWFDADKVVVSKRHELRKLVEAKATLQAT
jgi:hypothetical protein